MNNRKRVLGLGVFAALLIGTQLPAWCQNPDRFVMVTNWAYDTASIVSLKTAKSVKTISLGAKPYDIKIDPKTNRAYATNSAASDISVIDLNTLTAAQADRIKVGFGPRDLKISKSGDQALTANSGDNTMSIVDLKQKTHIDVAVGAIPYGVAYSNDESLAVVSNWGENSVSVIDLKLKKEIKRIPVGGLPYTILVPKNSKHAFLTSFASQSVQVIDLNILEVVKTIKVGRSPWGLACSDSGNVMAVCNFGSHEVSILDKDALSEKVRIDVEPKSGTKSEVGTFKHTKGACVSETGDFVVFGDLTDNTLSILDPTSGKVTSTISVGNAPYGIALLPTSFKVAEGADGSLSK